jgi:hypothetical protein
MGSGPGALTGSGGRKVIVPEWIIVVFYCHNASRALVMADILMVFRRNGFFFG